MIGKNRIKINTMFILTWISLALLCPIYCYEAVKDSASERITSLGAKINCDVEESQRFFYTSTNKLWGEMGGTILLNADVILHCLGKDEKHDSESCKYLVEISNLQIEEKHEKSLTRKKRGVGEFFSKAWNKIKGFFNRVFGRPQSQSEANRPNKDQNINRDEIPVVEAEEEEDFNSAELSSLYSIPFQFVQLANGSIPEILFSDEEKDSRIKNFKRHLVDAFATQLNFEKREKAVVETSVMGEHTSNYDVTLGGNKASYTTAGLLSSNLEEATVIVNKYVTESDILKLAPSEGNSALNDKDKMQLQMQQKQVFKKGQMIQSSGSSSVKLLKDDSNEMERKKRDTEEDMISYFYAHSSYHMQLQKRQKRSAETSARLKRHEEISIYNSSTRFAELEDSMGKKHIRNLQKSIGNATEFLYNILNKPQDDYDEKIQSLCEMVEREVNLKLDREPESISSALRKIINKEIMHEKCKQNFSKCKDFLQLLALAGGPEAEEVFLSFFNHPSSLNSLNLQSLADILSDISSPSSEFVSSLTYLLGNQDMPDGVLSTLSLSIGYLGSRSDTETKQLISNIFINIVDKSQTKCSSDPVMIDLLEAIGNLGYIGSIPHVLEVSALCKDDASLQIACAHALRNFMHVPSVKNWIYEKIKENDCEVIKAIIGTLLERVKQQEMEPETSEWPRYNFNDLDHHLLKQLQEKASCATEDIIMYFQNKKDPMAIKISQEFYSNDDGINSNMGRRKKRGLWDNLNCDEWTEDNKYRPIQDKEDFAADRAMYNKRKSCLAYRRLGIKRANAEIYAGIFAGVKEPSSPPKYKLFTKFVAALNFLDHEMEIGSFYFYHRSGRTKAYVRIMGRTRQEFSYDACTPTDLRYRPLKHIPIYLFSIASVQISLGIHLSSQLSLDTACPQEEQEVYELEPYAKIRVGGEAIGTLPYIQGGVNLGGNFNYKLQFTFTPRPDMCLRGEHGYDPMSISFETYYQLWNTAKNDWGKIRNWKPGFLSWQITRGAFRPWFQDTCIAPNSTNRYSYSPSERERE